MKTNISAKLKKYFNIKQIREMVDVFYVINYILLSLYLLIIPIQIGFSNSTNQFSNYFEESIDYVTVALFIFHVFLYFDHKLYKWIKNTYISWYQHFISISLIYDITCLILSLIVLMSPNTSIIIQTIIQIFFVFKFYTLAKYNFKCARIVYGTWFQPIHKMLRIVIFVCMALSYSGSIFYGIAYYLWSIDVYNSELLWIVNSPAIIDCIAQPLIIQIQYALYWALGTASFSAYGDVSATDPALVLYNILVLMFQGLLFGYYLNAMHSISSQRNQEQAQLIQKFNAFQQHFQKRKISKRLYLKILCSLQYKWNQKRKLDVTQKLLPKKYLKQIKQNIYHNFISDPTFFADPAFQLQISDQIQVVVCQQGQNVYLYPNIKQNDLFYIQQGSVKCSFAGQMRFISSQKVLTGQHFGIYSFVSGLLIKQRALCLNYCTLYKLKRQNYKKCLQDISKIKFYQLEIKSWRFQGSYLQRDPIIRVIYNLQRNHSDFVFLNPNLKANLALQQYQQIQTTQTKYDRDNIGSKKITPFMMKKRDASTQTKLIKQLQFQIVKQSSTNIFNCT